MKQAFKRNFTGLKTPLKLEDVMEKLDEICRAVKGEPEPVKEPPKRMQVGRVPAAQAKEKAKEQHSVESTVDMKVVDDKATKAKQST